MAVSGLQPLEAGLADTSVWIALERGRPLLEQLPKYLSISVVTSAELRLGLLSAPDPATQAQRLDTFLRAQEQEPLPIDGPVAAVWASMQVALRRAGRRFTGNDSWIAATAIAHRLPIVTQDADYDGVPGLEVIRV